jgi:adenine-specific DNA-methyltransferase
MAEIQKQELTSMNITEDQLQKLKQLFPEAFTEGLKVDWDKLRLTLGEAIDTGKERYGINWPGKSECFKTIQQPSIATLIPARDESVDFDTTQNLFIEGDNLEVLKLLQKSYLGKIKFMYFDPPYNTGKDFIYPDNYSESLETYLEYTGQVGDDGKKFGTNTDTDGRFHSKWMNMMYPRLFLSKNLLTEDGVIFLSIDDKEVHNLKSLCNEIFGEENFVGQWNWFKSATPPNLSKKIKKNIEYILCYQKGANNDYFEGLKKNSSSDDGITKPQNTIKELIFKAGDINTSLEDGKYLPGVYGTEKYPNELLNDLIVKNGKNFNDVKFRNRFTWTQPKLDEEIINKTVINLSKNLVLSIKKAEYKPEVPPNLIDKSVNVDTTENAGRFLSELFQKEKIFDYPKPISLIKYLLKFTNTKDEFVLDIFSGSATTAHSVLELNKEDNGNRKFICVQIPEPTEEKSEAFKAGFKTIAEIGKERIRKAATTIKNDIITEVSKKKEQIQFEEIKKENELDLGFKVYKLSKSNFKIWDATLEKSPELIQTKLFEHIHHISPEAEQEAILYELLLKSGFELTTPVEKLTLAGLTVFSIAEGQLLICLEKELTHDCLKEMAELQPTRVICLDEAFKGANADALKTNAVQIMKSKGVVNFRTV